MADLILCKGSFTESNELADEMKTLADYGIEGVPRSAEPQVIVPMFYDFKPVAFAEPLLLVSRGWIFWAVWADERPMVSEIRLSRIAPPGIEAL